MATSTHAHAQDRTESAVLNIKQKDDVTSYKFTSIADFDKNGDGIIDSVPQNATTVDGCQVTIEISITVSMGVVSTTVSGSVTASCADVAAAAKRLKQQLVAIATGL